MFEKVLVLNRGEIACRILRTLKRLGIKSVAVYSDADATAPHVRLADEAVRLGPAPVRESYLNLPAVEQAVRASGAQALHPGYGLLSESPTLARAVVAAGAVFVGPPPEALERLGDKISARALARSVGVQPPPGSEQPLDPDDTEALELEAARVGFPVILKAAAGGGGIGMLVVREPAELARAAKTCTDRAKQAFGDGRVYLERYLERPHHIEVQVLLDDAGQGVTLGERECSAQRRHQKVIEESPSPAPFFLGPAGASRREKLYRDALSIVRTAGYRNAGTVEFVVNGDGDAYFLEVNARLQVEHPVTELVNDLDLVEWQLRIAAGESLSVDVLNARQRGHAVEARLYAEDPARGFLPQPGRIEHLRWPAGLAGLRIDAGVEEGSEVTVHYDPLLAKLVAHGATRELAIERLVAALKQVELALVGPKGPRTTNLAALVHWLEHPEFRAGDYDTGFLQRVGVAP